VRAPKVTPPPLPLESVSDEMLMAKLKRGHSDALATLFDRYQSLVFRVASRILREQSEAEDLTQSVFLEIFRCAGLYDESKGSVKMWILQYAYHRSFNRRRYLALRGLHETSEEFLGSPELSVRFYGHSFLDGPESVRLLKQALRQLNRNERDTLYLVFYEGFTMREIAGKKGWSLDNVRHYYYRGLDKLRSIVYGRQERSAKAPAQDCVAHVQS
jgi:RNA polymerase sigma-70 factor, ECF subfamily